MMNSQTPAGARPRSTRVSSRAWSVAAFPVAPSTRTDAEISDAVCWNEQGEIPPVWRSQMHHLFPRLSQAQRMLLAPPINADRGDRDPFVADVQAGDLDGQQIEF
jgi:hypothetical protein